MSFEILSRRTMVASSACSSASNRPLVVQDQSSPAMHSTEAVDESSCLVAMGAHRAVPNLATDSQAFPFGCMLYFCFVLTRDGDFKTFTRAQQSYLLSTKPAVEEHRIADLNGAARSRRVDRLRPVNGQQPGQLRHPSPCRVSSQ